MRIKTNIPAGFTILDEAVANNDLVKESLASDTGGDILNLVLAKAEEKATDPNGQYQQVQVEAYLPAGYDLEHLSPEYRRGFVVLGTYPVVARAFHEAAAEVHDDKERKLVEHPTSAGGGFEEAFQEFRAASAILTIARASMQVMSDFDFNKLGDPKPRNIGKHVAAILNKKLSK